MHGMLLFCFGGWHYGLASTEAGATPASLVVISHLPPSYAPETKRRNSREADRMYRLPRV